MKKAIIVLKQIMSIYMEKHSTWRAFVKHRRFLALRATRPKVPSLYSSEEIEIRLYGRFGRDAPRLTDRQGRGESKV